MTLPATRTVRAPVLRPNHRSDARLRVGLFGILGSGNLGNDASLEAMVSFLVERHRQADLAFFAMGPEVVERLYGAPATSLQWYEANAGRFPAVPASVLKVVGRLLDPLRTLGWVRGQDVVIVPGMGVLESSTPTRPWSMPFALLCLTVAGRLTGTRVAFVSVGADVAGTRANRLLLVWAARLAHYRSYRDELSRRAMREMGLDVSKDPVYADLAFSLPVVPRRESTRRTVSLGVMNYLGGEHERRRADALHERYVATLQVVVRTLLQEGWQVHLFAGDVEDEPVVDRIREEVRAAEGPKDAPSSGRATTLEELMDELAAAAVVVATRFHGVLAAVHMSIPTVSISYAAKADALMADMGLRDYCQPAASLDAATLLEQIHRAYARRDAVVAMLHRRNDELAHRLEAQFRDLSRFLGGHTSGEVRPRILHGFLPRK